MREATGILDISRHWGSISNLDSDKADGTCTVYYGLQGAAVMTVEQRENRAFTSQKLNPYFGACFMLDLSSADGEIDGANLVSQIAPLEKELGAGGLFRRLLIRTAHKDADGCASHSYLTPDALLYLQAKGIILIGTDSPSIDPPGGRVNAAFMKTNRIVWLVNLDLQHVQEQQAYMLTALPLLPDEEKPLPARAMLIPVEER